MAQGVRSYNAFWEKDPNGFLSLGNWYRSRLAYDATTRIAENDLFDITDPGNPVHLVHLTAAPLAEFSEPLQYLGAKQEEPYYPNPIGAIAEAHIDTVRLEANVVPEPSTLIIWSLLGGFGIGVGWWRRKKAA